MTRILFTALLATAAALSGCKSKPKDDIAERKQAEMARQKKIAIETYKKIVERYPDSPEAEQARTKLSALDSAAGAKKK